MKYKSWLWWGLFAIAIIPVALFGPKLMGHLLTDMLEWLSQPVRYESISQREYDRIEEQFGITIPETAKLIERFHFPARDPTDIYVFALDTSGKDPEETYDTYLRRMLSLDEKQYKLTGSSSVDDIFYGDLAEVGLTYTSSISPRGAYFKEIHYKVTDNTIEVAFILG